MQISVNGSEVTISMLGVTTTYKIPSMRLLLPGSALKAVMTLEETENLAKENSDKNNSSASHLAFDLDYEKGTIGFREYGDETALFRKIRIELLQPIYK